MSDRYELGDLQQYGAEDEAELDMILRAVDRALSNDETDSSEAASRRDKAKWRISLLDR